MNPLAGGGRAGRMAAGVSSLLDRSGVPHRTGFSRDAGHLSELAADAAENSAAGVAVLGGDGTASHAFRGLLRSGVRIPLAVIPCGNGNDWCRTLRTRTVGDAVEAIASGRTALLDAGRFSPSDEGKNTDGGTPFVNSAGLGLDAHVLRRSLELRTRLPFGRTAYFSALASTLVEMPLWKGTLEVDGEHVFEGRFLSMTVGVCPYVGGGMMLSPASRPDDGLLDATVVLPITRRRLIRCLPQVYRGTLLGNPSVLGFRGKRLVFRPVSGICLELDGEPVDVNDRSEEFTMESLPGAVEVAVGENYSTGK